MNVRILGTMALVLGLGQTVFALESAPVDTPTPTVSKPVSLFTKEKMNDSMKYSFPRPPGKYVDGSPITLVNDMDNPPKDEAILNLNDSDTLVQIPVVNKADSRSGKHYWHPFKAWNYCHYKQDDRDWYGWRTGDAFHWVLWRSGHFWWRDNYAERWVYFDHGYWWWQSSKKPYGFQVFLNDGHYHACDANGALGDDLMRTGTEEVATEPVIKSTPEPGGRKREDGMGSPGNMGGMSGNMGMGSH